MSEISPPLKPKLRVAIEGCGHGTLNAIYASIEESCHVKGWDGVDLLIIGGDFQAVRNQLDLNVTSMPQRFRKMADFHEYYCGVRKAPYLTIFIGGNHEASNHLFELYYGGWVAPNIYYLGAANLLRFGPLRIAGLSGIWKGYDYRKPHFERLPYNQEDISSIYHVRELDVRKLLTIRSQIDIGLSHDWPQGIEWMGDHEWLFRAKKGFKEDAESGKLGSVAARQCLDRLRPPHWFSAHMHTKYVAIVQHGEYEPVRPHTARRFAQAPATRQGPDDLSEITSAHNDNGVNRAQKDSPLAAQSEQLETMKIASQIRPQVRAWQNFHADARQADADDRDRVIREQKEKKAEEERTGKRVMPQYVFNETFKKVTTDDSLGREITSIAQHETGPAQSTTIPNLDGCGFSKPASLKRRRDVDDPDKISITDEEQEPTNSMPVYLDGPVRSPNVNAARPIKNPDAIDIDMSDDQSEDGTMDDDRKYFFSSEPTKATSQATSPGNVAGHKQTLTHQGWGLSSPMSEDSADGGVKLNPGAASFNPVTAISSPKELDSEQMPSTEDSHPPTFSEQPHPLMSLEEPHSLTQSTDPDRGRGPSNGANEHQAEEISEEMRLQLAQLSSSFAPTPKRVEVSPALPLPAEISNKTTNFLALGKCERFQEFLQLLEIEAVSDDTMMNSEGPFKLSYDPEWLAILRVFAPELSLGGNPNDEVPPHRGETYYRNRIIEEEKWIDEHIVKKGLLQIPESSFCITAHLYDPVRVVDPMEMPREVTNPQTSALCQLIGIDNPFDLTEAERDERIAKGPRPESAGFGRSSGGARGGRGRGGRGGGGGRGGFSGGRGGRRGRGGF